MRRQPSYQRKTYTVTLTATIEVRAINAAIAMQAAADLRVIGSGGRTWRTGPHERDSTSAIVSLRGTTKTIKPTE